jgi:hypothetical protein
MELEFIIKLGITILVALGIFAWMMKVQEAKDKEAQRKFDETLRMIDLKYRKKKNDDFREDI